MKIFQPMLFVGLGGTGGLVGTELERRLRAELCGPDGTALVSGGRRLPHQLPECVQFVYADYSEAELKRLPHMSVDPALKPAYARTAQATHDLLPADYESSPEVTQMLRAVLREEVARWLPPREGEPKVTPLRSGAGQLPTVGRAALFATLRNGPAPVMEPLRRAIDALGRSGGELEELGGGPLSGCDVFVAFSVAGGTGAGIFLDYLHLIGQAFKEKKFRGARIYPLVVMPSAFPAARGGGREAELNAARAVVDLARLVDEQNVPDALAELGDVEHLEALTMRYPQMHPVRLRPGTVPTTFLFSPTAGIRPDDLRRCIVSLVMSLIGTKLSDARGIGTDDDSQTFASNFVNRDMSRRTRSAIGIGHQGVSTSLVASMTAPLDELAELVASRILAHAVRRLTDTSTPGPQETGPLVQEMFTAAGLADLWRREALEVPEPVPPPRGATDIETALHDRLDTMRRLLADLERRVSRQVAGLAEAFAPRVAADQMLRTVDLFTLDRVVRGVPGASDPVARYGFLGMLDNRRQDPARQKGVGVQPPAVPRIRNRMAGLSRPHWSDDEVVAAVEEQDRWYKWRARDIWHRAWNEQETRWRPAANDLLSDITVMTDAYRKHVEDEPRAFTAQVKELYDDRTGVSYLLPPQGKITRFYEVLKERLVESEQLGPNGDEAALLLKLVDADRRQAAFAAGRHAPHAAVTELKAVLERRVQRLFAERPRRARSAPLLPKMGTLLAAAAGDAQAAENVSKAALEKFGFKLAGLLPAGFTPEGNGPLKILITYPGSEGRAVEGYLEKALHLPADARRTIEYRSVDTDSITVVLFRSEMSLTEVPEVRNVLRQWARAQEQRRGDDILRWRQRLGYEGEWLAATAEDRKHILHRLLCAMWNGQVDFMGDDSSPRKVRIRLFTETEGDVPAITLTLDDYRDQVSSWPSLLRAYERWALLDEENSVQDYCRSLMRILPHGLGTSGSPPSPLYVKLVHEVAPRQIALLAERERRYGNRVADWVRPLREFWEEILPGALDVPFPNEERRVQHSLRELEEWVREGPRHQSGDPAGAAPGEEPLAEWHSSSPAGGPGPYAGGVPYPGGAGPGGPYPGGAGSGGAQYPGGTGPGGAPYAGGTGPGGPPPGQRPAPAGPPRFQHLSRPTTTPPDGATVAFRSADPRWPGAGETPHVNGASRPAADSAEGNWSTSPAGPGGAPSGPAHGDPGRGGSAAGWPGAGGVNPAAGQGSSGGAWPGPGVGGGNSAAQQGRSGPGRAGAGAAPWPGGAAPHGSGEAAWPGEGGSPAGQAGPAAGWPGAGGVNPAAGQAGSAGAWPGPDAGGGNSPAQQGRSDPGRPGDAPWPGAQPQRDGWASGADDDGVVVAPPAGRAAVVGEPEGRPAYPGFEDGPEDPAWPGGETAQSWGTADLDGADWDAAEDDGRGTRDAWDGGSE
jgi:Tubulin like